MGSTPTKVKSFQEYSISRHSTLVSKSGKSPEFSGWFKTVHIKAISLH